MLVAVMDVSRRVLAVTGPRTALGYGVAVGGTTAATAVLLLFREDVSKTNVVLTFLLVVVAAAATGGLGPGLGASALGFLAFDFLFLPPYYTFVVDERQDYLSLGVYLLIALVVSLLVGAVERRRVQAERRERETRTLFELSTSLVAHGGLDDTLERVARTVRTLFGLAGCAIVLAVGDLEQGRALTVPMRAGETVVGALVVVAGGPGSLGFGEAERRVLATFANQAALAVEQGQRDEERRHAEALVETDRLRTALLNSVSHDLRTPLASIKASASSLLDPEVHWDERERQEFLHTIARIEANALDPRLEATSLAEIAGWVVRRARSSASGGSTGQRVDVHVPESIPPVLADPVLLEQVLANLLDNAVRYAAGSPIAVTARELHGSVELRVIDHGPGIPEPERERVFDQFYRLKGGGRRPEGTGMGLSICRGIAAALRGGLRVETTPGGGATFILTLPVAARASEVPRSASEVPPAALAEPGRPGSGPVPEPTGRREGRP